MLGRIGGNGGLQRVLKLIEVCGERLKKWNISSFGNVKFKINEEKKRLMVLEGSQRYECPS